MDYPFLVKINDYAVCKNTGRASQAGYLSAGWKIGLKPSE
jgi:hypothetical protein